MWGHSSEKVPVDTPMQHVVNAAPAGITIAALWANLPEIVTVLAGIGAIIWYAILIAEKVVGWRAKWLQVRASARRVAAKEIEQRHEV